MASQTDNLFPIHSRICFLVCDPTKEEFVDTYGDFTNLFSTMFRNLLHSLVGHLGLLPHFPDVSKLFQLIPFKVFDGVFPSLATIDQFDSIIVSGSAYGVNDHQPWIDKLGKFLHKIATEHPNIKLIGVCFGHQIISNAVFDLPVSQNPAGWEIGPYRVDLNDTGKKLFPKKDHLNISMFHHDAVNALSTSSAFFTSFLNMASFTSTIATRTVHSGYTIAAGTTIAPSQGVTEETYTPTLPKLKEFKIWGSTARTPNQGIVALNEGASGDIPNINNIHIFTSQGHPEMTSDMISLLIDIFENEIGKVASDEGRKKIAEFGGGSLDGMHLALLMWVISTRRSVTFPQLSEYTKSEDVKE